MQQFFVENSNNRLRKNDVPTYRRKIEMLYFLLVKGTNRQYCTFLKKQLKLLTDHRHFEKQDSISHFVPKSIEFSVNICEKITTVMGLFM